MSYIKICPNCGSKNDGKSRFCIKCGNELPEQNLQTNQLPNQPYSNSEITYSPSRTNNYRATRFLSALLKLLAWVFFVLTILSIGGAILTYGDSYTSYNNYTLDPYFYLYVFAAFVTLPMSPIFALLSEGINVILDIEANTRQTAKILERILRSQS